jgi:phosphomannomutase
LQTLACNLTHAAQLLAPASGDIVSVNNLDGFRATFANGDIVHIHASGNAPELRCYAESDTSESAHLLSNAALQKVSKWSEILG